MIKGKRRVLGVLVHYFLYRLIKFVKKSEWVVMDDRYFVED